MAGLWRNNPATPEGKYPIVLRRDGTPMEKRYLVLGFGDPCAPAAIYALAAQAELLGLDPQYVADLRALAEEAELYRLKVGAGDPDAPPHRPDDPIVLAWARSIGMPGG